MGYMGLGQVINFFNYLNRDVSNVNQYCWILIKELSIKPPFLSLNRELLIICLRLPTHYWNESHEGWFAQEFYKDWFK